MATITHSEVSRVKGETIVKPIIYGNCSRYFGKKREEDNHTHSWVLYVKPYVDEDMSKYVRKVVFKLHESYAQPMRVFTEPPYEVKETGWGEFEAVIKIFFLDAAERHVTIYHQLKLFNLTDPAISAGKKILVNEYYDEIIFQDPTLLMYNALTINSRSQVVVNHFGTDFEQKKQNTIKAIQTARDELRTEVNDLKDCLKESKELINKFREEINKAEQDGGQKSVT